MELVELEEGASPLAGGQSSHVGWVNGIPSGPTAAAATTTTIPKTKMSTTTTTATVRRRAHRTQRDQSLARRVVHGPVLELWPNVAQLLLLRARGRRL